MIHCHVFIAGYVFTAAFISMDPVAHLTGFMYRASVLIVSLAGHGILSKYIYAHPPGGVSETEAQCAGMLMYYGGDLIDIGIIFVLCYK